MTQIHILDPITQADLSWSEEITVEIYKRIPRVVATLWKDQSVSGWDRDDAAWLRQIIQGTASKDVFCQKAAWVAVCESLCTLGKEMFRRHTTPTIWEYIEHCQSPHALAYAICNGVFTADELNQIRYDDHSPAEFWNLGLGLEQKVLGILFHGNPGTRSAFHDNGGHFCEGGACDDPD